MSLFAPGPSVDPDARAQLVRCACRGCGAHLNALRAPRLVGSCANCGSFELEPIDGAEPLRGAFAPPVGVGPLRG